MKSAGSAVSSGFSAFQAKVSADTETLKANVKHWKKDLDAKRAENSADEMEWEASMAIDYAISAVEQAKLAAIDAAIARQEAIDARKGSQSARRVPLAASQQADRPLSAGQLFAGRRGPRFRLYRRHVCEAQIFPLCR